MPDAERCSYCDREFQAGFYGTARTKDHVIPRSLMVGTNQTCRGNIVPACGNCNSIKGDMMPSALRAMAQEHRKRADLLDRMADRVDVLIEERGLIPAMK